MTAHREAPTTDDATLGIEQTAKLMRLGVEATRELILTGKLEALSCNQKHYVLLREVVLDYIRTEGRKQAAVLRLKAAAAPAPSAPARGPSQRRPGKRQKQALPDLSRYEITTTAQPGSTPAGSRNA